MNARPLAGWTIGLVANTLASTWLINVLDEKYTRNSNESQKGPLRHRGATVAERLACLPPTKANRVQSPAGSLRMFACGNRAGRCRWSAGFFGDLPFPPPFHSGAAPYLNHPHRISRPRWQEPPKSLHSFKTSRSSEEWIPEEREGWFEGQSIVQAVVAEGPAVMTMSRGGGKAAMHNPRSRQASRRGRSEVSMEQCRNERAGETGDPTVGVDMMDCLAPSKSTLGLPSTLQLHYSVGRASLNVTRWSANSNHPLLPRHVERGGELQRNFAGSSGGGDGLADNANGDRNQAKQDFAWSRKFARLANSGDAAEGTFPENRFITVFISFYLYGRGRIERRKIPYTVIQPRRYSRAAAAGYIVTRGTHSHTEAASTDRRGSRSQAAQSRNRRWWRRWRRSLPPRLARSRPRRRRRRPTRRRSTAPGSTGSSGSRSSGRRSRPTRRRSWTPPPCLPRPRWWRPPRRRSHRCRKGAAGAGSRRREGTRWGRRSWRRRRSACPLTSPTRWWRNLWRCNTLEAAGTLEEAGTLVGAAGTLEEAAGSSPGSHNSSSLAERTSPSATT
ncbi:hypothetical protein PR048_027466 [Dryococelus australis]|uniref:Uncharacterized protein n=1 Tax=Dryococelus australis TaxID=614101 RepID=A0ABQ9GFJ9_9NEOP|nr:hypothetical protein PR048_027466 [Dryococelus australis]